MTTSAKKAIHAYATIFVPVENKYSILKQTRIYSASGAGKGFGLVEVLDIFSNIFSKDFNENKLNLFFEIISNYQREYYKIVIKIYEEIPKSEDRDNFLKNIKTEHKKIIDQGTNLKNIKLFYALLCKIDKTETNITKNIEQYSQMVESFNTDKLGTAFKNFFNIYSEYRELVNDKKFAKYHTDDVVINEFIQYLTHFSYSIYSQSIRNETENEKIKENTINYYNENLRKSLSHLQRATLDVYKIIINIYLINERLSAKNKMALLNARQNEIDSISCHTSNATEKYWNIIKSLKKENQ